MTMEYELRHVAKATQLSPRRLRGWLERGHPIAHVLNKPRRGKGPGCRLKYTIDEMLRLAIVAELTRAFGMHFRPGFFTKWLWKVPADLLWQKRVVFFSKGTKVIFDLPGLQPSDLPSLGIIDMEIIRRDVLERLKD